MVNRIDRRWEKICVIPKTVKLWNACLPGSSLLTRTLPSLVFKLNIPQALHLLKPKSAAMLYQKQNGHNTEKGVFHIPIDRTNIVQSSTSDEAAYKMNNQNIVTTLNIEFH